MFFYLLKVPAAGTVVLGVESEARAKEVIQWRRRKELEVYVVFLYVFQ